jgi:apolipoprotein D and lipocalin family protein
MKISNILMVVLLAIGCNSPEDSAWEPLETVPYVDIARFMGDWYVIANIPTFIEKGATNAVESYKLNEQGEIETTFSFFQDSPTGKKNVYTPKGFIHNTQTNAEWRMQFIRPFKMPFLIIDLAADYSHTVIGYPNRNYVWIMARNPQLPADTYTSIIQKLEGVGYDISTIEMVPQQW